MGSILEYQPRLLTAADLAVLPSHLPSGDVRYELHQGMLLIMPPPEFMHSTAATNLMAELKLQVERRGYGKARGCVGVILARNPDTVYGPDVVFITNARLPVRKSPEDYLETLPELIAEVRGKNDTIAALERKALEYLQAGAVVVWVVDPIKRNVVEYRRGVESRTFGEEDTLIVPDLIPDFAVSVRAVLEE